LVLCDIVDGVGSITLNRPEKGNAINSRMAAALIAAVDEVASNRLVRAVLLTGNGTAFCVGGDIGEMQEATDLPALMERGIGPLHDAILKLSTLPVPVLSALNGPIGGGGVALALCADLIVAAESMKLRGGYSAIGLTPDLGASWFLARRAGEARAKEILFLNRPVNAAQCRGFGIVDAVYPDAVLRAEARGLAAQLAHAATLSLQRIKELVDGAGQRSLADHLSLERDYMIASARSEDGREGVAAFIAKRAPQFVGR
jgi:2-(1,2-epoxy-1,2-dihydrophenyl)acetyl-CoA isomerase